MTTARRTLAARCQMRAYTAYTSHWPTWRLWTWLSERLWPEVA